MLQPNMSGEKFHSCCRYDRKILQRKIRLLELTVIDYISCLSLCDQDKNNKP